MQKSNITRNTFLIGAMLAAVATRMLPHPVNFAPVGALALFGAAYFPKKWMAILAPLAVLWLSDLFINNVVYATQTGGMVWFYSGFYWMYGATLLTTLVGFGLLKKVTVGRVAGSALMASILFFLITNFACWPGNPMYAQTGAGLLTCMLAGIPFFSGTLLGNLFYSAVMFGGFELAKNRIPALRLQTN